MVQCHKELSGCGGGGWTPVMKIDGSKVWFTFSSWETLICTLIHIHLINTSLPNRLTFKYMFCNFKNKPHFSSLFNLRSFGIYRLGWDRTGDRGSHCFLRKRKGISRPLQSIREKGGGALENWHLINWQCEGRRDHKNNARSIWLDIGWAFLFFFTFLWTERK